MAWLRGRIPDSPAGKARLTGASIAVAMLLAQAGGMGTATHSVAWVSTSIIALLALAGVLAVTYVARRLPPLEPLWVPVLVVVAGSGLSDAIAAMGLCMAVAVAQSMYGSTATWALRSVLITAAVPVVVAVSPYSLGQHISWHGQSAIAPLPALLLICVLMRAFYRSLIRQQQAGEREAVLASCGGQLIGVTDPHQVCLLGATAAERLSELSSGASHLILEQSSDGVVVLHGVGSAASLVGATLPSAVVAELATAEIGEIRHLTTDPVAFVAPASAPWHWRAMVLPTTGATRYLLVGGTHRMPDDVVNAYRSLAHQLTFAEENCRAHRNLDHQANHDHLTMLPNRGQFFRRLTAAIDEEVAVTLMVIDLDDFKHVNDVYGHGAGDDLLVEVAGRLNEIGGPHCLAARFGGDEFALLLLDDSQDAEALAQRLCLRLMEPMCLPAGVVTVGASIGLAASTAELTAGDLLRCADIAMYSAKAAGKNRVERFTTARHGDVARHRLLEEHLAHAVERDEIVVHYQPCVDLATGDCTGVQADPWWRHHGLGLLRPEEFVPIAERVGRIATLGAHTLRTACAELAARPTSPAGAELRLSVDVATAQLLDPGFAATVRQILTETSFPAERLILQVVDSAQLHEETIRHRLLDLSDAGVRMALRDFGSADTSLASLRSLPIRRLKTSLGVLTAHAERFDANDMLRLVVSVGNILDLEVVAGEVDTPAQADRLRAAGIGYVQGAAYADPMPAPDLRQWLSRRTPMSTAGTNTWILDRVKPA